MPNGPELTAADLVRDGNLDGKSQNQLFFSFVAEAKDEQGKASKLVGYSISFFSYSTWQGKSYFLEDIYVKPDYRKTGIGKKLFATNVKFGISENCSRFDFHVLNWNPAKKFYESPAIGATNLSAKEGWEFYRLNRGEMEALVSKTQ